MFDKLAEVESRYQELERLMLDPNLLGQQKEYSRLAKERSELEEIVTCFREWKKVEREIQENRSLLEENDEAMRELTVLDSGGVLYLYLRGMCGPQTPVVDGHPCGVFSWQPPVALVEALSNLLDGVAPAGAGPAGKVGAA